MIYDAQNIFDEITIIGFKYRKIKSSSLQSIERGRRTEIDFLNGYICDRGRDFNVSTPLNDAVRAQVLEIEDGKRKFSLDNKMTKLDCGVSLSNRSRCPEIDLQEKREDVKGISFPLPDILVFRSLFPCGR